MTTYDKMLRPGNGNPHVPQKPEPRLIQPATARALRCNEPGCKQRGQLPGESCLKHGHALAVAV